MRIVVYLVNPYWFGEGAYGGGYRLATEEEARRRYAEMVACHPNGIAEGKVQIRLRRVTEEFLECTPTPERSKP